MTDENLFTLNLSAAEVRALLAGLEALWKGGSAAAWGAHGEQVVPLMNRLQPLVD